MDDPDVLGHDEEWASEGDSLLGGGPTKHIDSVEAERLKEWEDRANRRALMCSMLSLLMSVPALIGACCWPALVFPLVGVSITAVSRKASHLISFSINLFIVSGIVIYLGVMSRSRKGSAWKRFGPLVLGLCAVVFIMADPSRHLLMDYKLWPHRGYFGSAMYKKHCGETFQCLTFIGFLFSVVLTYAGFALLTVSSLWNANFVQKLLKIRDHWGEIQKGSVKK